MNVRDTLEMFALVLGVTATALATWPLVWPALVVLGLALAYLSHAWSWEPAVSEADELRAGLARITEAARRSPVTKGHLLDSIEAVIADGDEE